MTLFSNHRPRQYPRQEGLRPLTEAKGDFFNG